MTVFTALNEARASASYAEYGYGYCARCDSEVDSNDRCDCDACNYCGEREGVTVMRGERVCAECADDMSLTTLERVSPTQVGA